MRTVFSIAFLLCICTLSSWAQTGSLTGTIIDKATGKGLVKVEVRIGNAESTAAQTDRRGNYLIPKLPAGSYSVTFFKEGFGLIVESVEIKSDEQTTLSPALTPLQLTLPEYQVSQDEQNSQWMEHMRAVEGTAIYASMKNETVRLEHVSANLSTNNSRQVYAKIPGLNIWESDGAGLQLGIGGRGLSPNRTSNFNVRQNFYDISADALGYPESYYSPPLEAVERIEIVRGAASLQYGTQFGGLLNFRMKRGPKDKPIEVVARQTIGSFGLQDTISPAMAATHSFVSVGGTAKKINYYVFHNWKNGHGWRPNSGYDAHTTHGNVHVEVSEKLKLGVELTYMNYLAQQPGGLIDVSFEDNPRQSIRDRNWFAVNWKLGAFHLHYRWSPALELSLTTFGLSAERRALGHLGQAGRIDPETNRDLIWGNFSNWGNETRLLHRFDFNDQLGVIVLGTRYYHGQSRARQGMADASSEANFEFLSPNNLEGSDYTFPNENLAAYLQGILPLTKRLSLIPGARVEHIRTEAEGSYRNIIYDGAGNAIEDTVLLDQQMRSRSFMLGGLGMSLKLQETLEVYGNLSQNYRAINFTDIQIRNTNQLIDPDIQDEKGFNADLGVRGSLGSIIQFDVSAFALYYRDRIGSFYTSVPDPVLIARPVRYRTNISDSRNLGIEAFFQTNLSALFRHDSTALTVHWFVNASWIDARYLDSDEPAFDGNLVELVPQQSFKTGLNAEYKGLSAGAQFSYTGEQFSDATNAVLTPDAVDGIIPAYHVMDLTMKATHKRYGMEMSVNNVLDRAYFTRRASGYPGPGIIPSEGRSYYLTFTVKI